MFQSGLTNLCVFPGALCRSLRIWRSSASSATRRRFDSIRAGVTLLGRTTTPRATVPASHKHSLPSERESEERTLVADQNRSDADAPFFGDGDDLGVLEEGRVGGAQRRVSLGSDALGSEVGDERVLGEVRVELNLRAKKISLTQGSRKGRNGPGSSREPSWPS